MLNLPSLIIVSSSQEVKRKRTETIKKSNNPQYQESLNFRVDEKDLNRTAVKAMVMQHIPFPERGKGQPKT